MMGEINIWYKEENKNIYIFCIYVYIHIQMWCIYYICTCIYKILHGEDKISGNS